MKKYDFKKIEAKWQKAWGKAGIYAAKDFSKKPKYYALVEFPYPSGDGLHVGHIRSYTAMDIVARKRRMEGKNVIYPIGWDAFGLPTENYAVKTGIHPAIVTKKNTDTFRRQLKSVGFSFDWNREIATTDPAYYTWTQWIFLQFFKAGLAYKATTIINWCPSCKIGLANEEVVAGKCERCGTPVIEKEKEQWMLKITAYAEKLLEGLKHVDFLPEIKAQQVNWIGRSEGAELRFPVTGSGEGIVVFTTRPDTLFGATYIVLAPEHPLIKELEPRIQNVVEVRNYITMARGKTDEERGANKEKTGIELKGVRAVNPATKMEIPIWVADYVLASYGTGAIMAVPAHDERDFEFAKKFRLPIEQVIRPVFGAENERPDAVARETVSAFVRNKKGEVLLLKWKEYTWLSGIIGGIEKGETPEEAAVREVLEETGYHARAVFVSPIAIESHFFAEHKNEWRARSDHAVLLELESGEREPISDEEAAKHEARWIKVDEALRMEMFKNNLLALELAVGKIGAYTESRYGETAVLMNSGKFNGMDSDKGKWEIMKFAGGIKAVRYKLRDWIFSRQRYWGEPIPVVRCEKCGYVPVPEKELPIELPKVKEFRPRDDGESPLASLARWVNTKCPECKGPAKRETDVMPNWAGSSWYFLRYTDPKNKKAFADFKKLQYWTPIDWYNGGMEHVTLHLLYSRFWNQFLFDQGLVPQSEPYKKRTAHGLILGEGGVKMSKSKGNVINPDTIVQAYGADTLRVYEMFMGPFDQAIAWDAKSIGGASRFLGKIWAIAESGKISSEAKHEELERLLHKTIKKVGDDVEVMAFNTAISAMMIFINETAAAERVPLRIWERFLLLLAPFAPHMAEELWQNTANGTRQMAKGKFKSIHLEAWPSYNKRRIEEETFTLVIQVNGKVRDTLEAPATITEKEAQDRALGRDKIKHVLDGKAPKKVIYVPKRIVNIVV